MKRQTLINTNFFVVLLMLLGSYIAQGQCVVDSIGIADCEIGTIDYVIPVYVEYTGKPDSVKVSATGLAYEFEDQYFRMFQHFKNPLSKNTFHFPVYNISDGVIDNVLVTVTLIGHECNQEYLTKPIMLDDPACICNEFLILTGSISQDLSYIVRDFINSTQTITAGTDIIYSAKNYVDWGANFSIELGATLEINNIGCDIN